MPGTDVFALTNTAPHRADRELVVAVVVVLGVDVAVVEVEVETVVAVVLRGRPKVAVGAGIVGTVAAVAVARSRKGNRRCEKKQPFCYSCRKGLFGRTNLHYRLKTY